MAFWEETINILQNSSNPIVDKPKLAEKYLTKPPFRFLHDTVSAVQKNTGFAPGLYTDAEMDHNNLQDKETKVAYLNKIIDVVGIFLNEPIAAKPLKIVAGLEPELTNLFLQKLGIACRKGNAADAVKRVLAGEHQGEGKAAAPAAEKKAAAPKAAKPADPAAAAPAAKAAKPAADPAAAPAKAEKKAAPAPAAKDGEPSASASPEKVRRSSTKTRAPAPAPEAEAHPPAAPAPAAAPAKPAAKPAPKREAKPKAEEPPPPAPAPAPVAAAPPTPPVQEERPNAVMARPQSARKAPPKVASNTDQPAVRAGARPPSAQRGGKAGGANSNILSRPVNVFTEGDKGGDDDDVEVVHEATPSALGIRNANAGGAPGVLVQNILEAEKQLSRAPGSDPGNETAQEGTGPGIIIKRSKPTFTSGGGAGGGRALDPAALREAVQRLVSTASPLAKILDYLGEDVENMAKEYRFWVTEKRMYQDRLNEEQRMAGDQGQGEAQIADLDAQIKQVKDRILGTKAQTLRNDDSISKLLTMAVSG